MSTRANYVFYKNGISLCIAYIHYDGYSSGAANYFQKALLLGDGRINNPREFLRANPEAELCSDIHGDIEYLYTFDIDKQTILVEEIYYTKRGRQRRRFILEESIYDFINSCYSVFGSNETLKRYEAASGIFSSVENGRRVENENKWFYIPVQNQFGNTESTPLCLALIYQRLTATTQEIIDKAYPYGGTSNPNYLKLIRTQNELIKNLENIIIIHKMTKEEE